MKKLSLLFLSAAMITFASCGDEPKSTEPTQAQLDSIANAKSAMEAEMNAKNDSLNAALSKLKDDSAAMAVQRQMDSVAAATAAKANKGSGKTAKPTTIKTPPVVTPPPSTNPKGDKMNGGNTSVDDKKDKMNGEAGKSNTQSKKDKMNRGNN